MYLVHTCTCPRAGMLLLICHEPLFAQKLCVNFNPPFTLYSHQVQLYFVDDQTPVDASVLCPDKKTRCPDVYTCCNGTSGYNCCPFRTVVFCSFYASKLNIHLCSQLHVAAPYLSISSSKHQGQACYSVNNHWR